MVRNWEGGGTGCGKQVTQPPNGEPVLARARGKAPHVLQQPYIPHLPSHPPAPSVWKPEIPVKFFKLKYPMNLAKPIQLLAAGEGPVPGYMLRGPVYLQS